MCVFSFTEKKWVVNKKLFMKQLAVRFFSLPTAFIDQDHTVSYTVLRLHGLCFLSCLPFETVSHNVIFSE